MNPPHIWAWSVCYECLKTNMYEAKTNSSLYHKNVLNLHSHLWLLWKEATFHLFKTWIQSGCVIKLLGVPRVSDTFCLPPLRPLPQLDGRITVFDAIWWTAELWICFSHRQLSCPDWNVMDGQESKHDIWKWPGMKGEGILCAFFSPIPKPHKGIYFFFLDCFCQKPNSVTGFIMVIFMCHHFGRIILS